MWIFSRHIYHGKFSSTFSVVHDTGLSSYFKFKLLKESLSFPELTYQSWCQNLGSTVPLADGNKRRPWTRGMVDKDMKAARDTLTPMTIGTLAVNPPTTELACLLLQLKAIWTFAWPRNTWDQVFGIHTPEWNVKLLQGPGGLYHGGLIHMLIFRNDSHMWVED